MLDREICIAEIVIVIIIVGQLDNNNTDIAFLHFERKKVLRFYRMSGQRFKTYVYGSTVYIFNVNIYSHIVSHMQYLMFNIHNYYNLYIMSYNKILHNLGFIFDIRKTNIFILFSFL